MKICVPSNITLKKYGLSLTQWQTIWANQHEKCPICGKEPKTGSPREFNIDHEHITGWKKLKPEDRLHYVRGIICHWCNRSYMAKRMTMEKAQCIIAYLHRYNQTKHWK